MKSIVKTFTAAALLIAVAAPASALIDPALDQEFFNTATRAVTEADIPTSNPELVQQIEAPVGSNRAPRTYNDIYTVNPDN